ncbi:MAG: hypothetical protein M3Q39_16030 [Actinomycetota bacterium]|nr:hypothetical protein [Actinomycetota bacterium]
MLARQTVWGDVWPFAFVRDKAGVVWKITDEKSGWVKLKNRAGHTRSIPRPEPIAPVTVMENTEAEAVNIIQTVFPGSRIIDIIETKEHHGRRVA